MSEPNRPDDDGPPTDTREPIRAEFDWSKAIPCTAIVETVAIAANREPTELDPLYEAVDPEALDTLIQSMETNSTVGDATVTFAFDGHEVTVHRDGRVVVRSAEARAESE